MSINLLYSCALSGDSEAEKRLFQQLTARFRMFAIRRVRDKQSSEELIQDALIKILKSYRAREPHSNFSAWAYAVLKGEISNYHRKIKRRRKHLDSMCDKDSIIYLESRPILTSKLMDCFKKLVNSNQKYARVLNLRYQGYSSDEVSRRLEIDINNLYIILHRARKALLSCLNEEGDSDE